MSCFHLGGSQFVNFTNGTVRFTVMAESDFIKSSELETVVSALDPTARKADGTPRSNRIAMYTAEVTVPDTGLSIPLGTIYGTTREMTNIFDAHGSYAGTTVGNEILNENTMTIGWKEDFLYLNDNPYGHVVSRDTLRSMILGGSFMNEVQMPAKVVGTNGTVKRGKECSSEHEFALMFLEDGMLTIPQSANADGVPTLVGNSRVSAYNRTGVCVMVEFLFTYSQTKKVGYRYVYSLAGVPTYNEADDVNGNSVECQLLCDVRFVKEFFFKGINSHNVVVLNTTGINSVGTIVAEPADVNVIGATGVSAWYKSNYGIDFTDVALVGAKDTTMNPLLVDAVTGEYILVPDAGTQIMAAEVFPDATIKIPVKAFFGRAAGVNPATHPAVASIFETLDKDGNVVNGVYDAIKGRVVPALMAPDSTGDRLHEIQCLKGTYTFWSPKLCSFITCCIEEDVVVGTYPTVDDYYAVFAVAGLFQSTTCVNAKDFTAAQKKTLVYKLMELVGRVQVSEVGGAKEVGDLYVPETDLEVVNISTEYDNLAEALFDLFGFKVFDYNMIESKFLSACDSVAAGICCE